MTSKRFDAEQCRAALSALREPGTVTELRVLNTSRGTASGYFDDVEKLIECAGQYSGEASGVYITVTPVKPDLLARSKNRVKPARHCTTHRDILRRRWLTIDCDPQRPLRISATEEEHEAALVQARKRRDWLRSQEWPDPIYADSGNGAHLMYALDLSNDVKTTGPGLCRLR